MLKMVGWLHVLALTKHLSNFRHFIGNTCAENLTEVRIKSVLQTNSSLTIKKAELAFTTLTLYNICIKIRLKRGLTCNIEVDPDLSKVAHQDFVSVAGIKI